jgi:hypothetical protein
MKKIIFILLLFAAISSEAQTSYPGYTTINSRYLDLGRIFKELGLPAGGNAAFTSGQLPRAGAIYYDSTGVDSGLHVWSGLAWRKYITQSALDDTAAAIRAAGIYTASQGITKTGNDFQFGGTSSSPATLTTSRRIDINRNRIIFTVGDVATSNYPFQVFAKDTISSNGMSSDSLLPTGTTAFQRHIDFTGPYAAEYKIGHGFSLTYRAGDSARIASVGGDFGGAVFNSLNFARLPSYTGRTAFRLSNSTLTDNEAPYAAISNINITGSSGSNHMYLRGWLNSHSSYIVMQSSVADTLENHVFYGGSSFIQSPNKVLKQYFMHPAVMNADSMWFLHDTRNYNSYLGGGLAIGGGERYANTSALIDVSSTSKGVVWPRMTTVQKDAIASPATGLIVFDTDLVEYNFWDGDSWESMGGGGGGGGTWGSITGTLSDQTDLQTALDLKAPLASPTFAGTVTIPTPFTLGAVSVLPTGTELNFVDGVTSAIQPQIDGKIDGSLTAGRIPYATDANTLADNANFVWDNTNSRVGIARATPIDKLDVSGGIRGSGTGTLTALGSSFSLDVPGGNTRLNTWGGNSSTRGGFTVRQTSSTGTLAITSFDLDANGDLTLLNLAGTGTRTVLTSSTGKLSAGKAVATLTKAPTIENPVTGDNLWGYRTPVAITITDVYAVLVGSSSPSVTYNIVFDADRSAAGTSVYTSDQTVTSTTTGTAASGVNDNTIPAGSWIRIKIPAQSGTVNQINFTITYTED